MAITITPTQFRADFPEFADSTVYTDGMVTFWAGVAVNLINECRWGKLAMQGAELILAHYLDLQAQDVASVGNGGAPGQSSGPIASMAVDKVNIAFDANVAAIEGGGAWNLTSYGTRYLTLALLVGAGGMQLPGGGLCC